jgi:hypothetical protein
MDQPFLIHPFFLIHDDALQHGDLGGGATERQQTHFAESREEFFETWLLYWLCHAAALNDPIRKLSARIITGS